MEKRNEDSDGEVLNPIITIPRIPIKNPAATSGYWVAVDLRATGSRMIADIIRDTITTAPRARRSRATLQRAASGGELT
jgi:hypothetical protein